MGVETWAYDLQSFITDKTSDPNIVTATGTASISSTVGAPVANKYWKIKSIDLHFNTAAGTGTLTITKNSNSGSQFDTNLKSITMDTVTDYAWVPIDDSPILGPNDTIDISFINSAGKTFGLTVMTKVWYG